MRRAQLLALPLVFALIASACAEGATGKKNRSSDDDDTSSDGVGGAGGSIVGAGGAKPSIEEGCDAVCANAAEASCPDFNQVFCVADCENLRTQAPESCVATTDALVGCWSTATPLCGAEGIVFEGCETQEQAYVDCLSNPSTTTTTTTTTTATTTSGGGGCAHSECVEGSALVSSCSSCASSICSVDPYCCSTAWDSACVSQAYENPSCGC